MNIGFPGKQSFYPGIFMVCMLVLLLPMFSIAQDRANLQKEKENIEKEIEYTTRLIRETQKSAENSLSHLVLINKQISQRETLIANYNRELALLNRQISSENSKVEQLTSQLNELKDSYARMVQFAYRSRNSHDRMMFLFSAKDFNQAYLRLKYLQQYSRHRQLQAQKILETKSELQEKIVELEQKRKEQQKVVAAQAVEMQALQKEKDAQSQTVNSLKRKEKELMANLKEMEKVRTEIQRSIDRLIAEERRKAAEAARKAGRPVTAEPGFTPEETALSENFFQNKGKLPWPSERGVITGTFGEHPHPVLPNIKVKNDGVNIATNQGAHARAIFKGTVSGVVSIPGAHQAVIIRHGEYLTVYSNLAEVFVKNGQEVNTLQSIGVISTNTRESKTEIHFQIRKGNTILNPADWLARNR